MQVQTAQASGSITIDWSTVLTPETEGKIEEMIGWVQTYPQRNDIHVFLGCGRHRAAGRKLQNALLALGCTVTNRCSILA